MELTVGDTTDKDKDMKDMKKTFKDNAEVATPKVEKKKAPISLESLLKPNIEKEEATKKASLFELLGGRTEEVKDTDDSKPIEVEADLANEVGETQVPLEEISEAEKTEVAQEYIAVTSAEVTEELTQAAPDTVEEAEALASQAFLDELQNKVNGNESLDEEVIEEAGNQALEALDIESINSEVQEEVEESSRPEEEIEVVENETNDAEEDDYVQPTPVSAGSPVSTPPITPPIPGRGAVTPAAAVPPAAGGRGTPVSATTSSGMNTVPTGNMNALNPSTVDKRRDAKKILVGALAGYMIGRRRGRIKTENRLLPIQHKLEKQIGDLHEKLTTQELKVRKLAAMQFEQNQARSLRQFERAQDSKNSQLDANNTQEAASLSYENNEERREGPQSVEKKPGVFERTPSPKSVETMTVPLLLVLAETIIISGTSLRAMYEQGRFDQNQLRMLVKESLNGEKIDQKVLEILAGQEVLGEQGLDRRNDPVNGQGSPNPGRQPRILTNSGSSSLSEPEIEIPNSPVIQSILDSQQQRIEQKKSPTTLLVILAVVTGIGIILVAGLISS